jgi:hypothetical protein
MITPYIWHEAYRTAVLETDWIHMPKRIQAAESAIHERQRVLSLDHGGTPAERQAIEDALNGLKVVRRESADWLARQERIPDKQSAQPACPDPTAV